MNLFDIITEDVSLATSTLTETEDTFLIELFGIKRKEKTLAQKHGRTPEEQARVEKMYSDQKERDDAHDPAHAENDQRTKTADELAAEKQRKADWKASGRQAEDGKASGKMAMDAVDMPGHTPKARKPANSVEGAPVKGDYFRHKTGVYKVVGFDHIKKTASLKHAKNNSAATVAFDKMKKLKELNGKTLFVSA